MKNFSKILHHSIVFCLIYAVIMAFVLGKILAFSLFMITGLLIGAAAANLNLYLLLVTFRARFDAGNSAAAAGCYLIRLAIYCGLAIVCLNISFDTLIAYAAGVLGVIPGLLLGVLTSRGSGDPERGAGD